MQKILLHGQDLDVLAEIRTTIENSLPFPIYTSTEMREGLDLVNRQLFNLLLFQVPYFSMEHFEQIKIFRGRGFSAPVLVSAEAIQSPLFFGNRDTNKMHWLPVPHTEKDLVGLIRKLLAARKASQQIHRRFRTNQSAALETLTEGDVFRSDMYNLSKGGAYCEYEGEPLLSVGDMIRLRIPLKDLNRDHTLNARVVWNTKRGAFSGRYGLGLKFVKPEDVHRFLMEKV